MKSRIDSNSWAGMNSNINLKDIQIRTMGCLMGLIWEDWDISRREEAKRMTRPYQESLGSRRRRLRDWINRWKPRVNILIIKYKTTSPVTWVRRLIAYCQNSILLDHTPTKSSQNQWQRNILMSQSTKTPSSNNQTQASKPWPRHSPNNQRTHWDYPNWWINSNKNTTWTLHSSIWINKMNRITI